MVLFFEYWVDFGLSGFRVNYVAIIKDIFSPVCDCAGNVDLNKSY